MALDIDPLALNCLSLRGVGKTPVVAATTRNSH
jgi:hypothetical protein